MIMKAHLSRGVFFAFFICLSLAVGGQPLMAEEVPAAVQQAAKKGLPTFLNAIPDDNVQRFGFSVPEELKLATLGTPIRLYTIDPDEILNYSADKPIGDIISATDQWFFPVTVSGEVRTLLTVAQMGGKWQAVSIGSSALGQEWADTIAKYDSMGYTDEKLVRIYQATADFVLLRGVGDDKLLPLKAGKVALGVKEDAKPSDPADIIFGLQVVVKQNIEAYK
jgi:hypothetical protein